jgi:class 3 adenylate cyclase
VSDADDFVAAGLYDPDADDAEARLALLTYLTDEIGASIPEIMQAYEAGGMLSFAAFRTLRTGRDRLTLAEVAERANISADKALLFWRCAGFADPRPFERRFGQSDVEALQMCGLLMSLVGEQRALSLIRTFGEAIARVADAEVALLRSNIEAPLAQSRQYVEVARAYVAVANELFPRISGTLDSFHRHHLQAIGRRYSDVDAPTSASNVVDLAIAFADLSGFTGLSQRLEADAFGEMIDRFETVTGDVITGAVASVAKRIGDAVMFVSNAPGIACALALDLIDACATAQLPKLRVGVAFGEVIVRQGDFYGGVINLAARLVNAADPGTALADATLYSRLNSVRGRYAFLPAGKLPLHGFDDPVDAYQLLRP